MTKHQQSVKNWMQKAGIEVPTSPAIPSFEDRTLCAKLLLEETMETINKGLGLLIIAPDSCCSYALKVGDLEFLAYHQNHHGATAADDPSLVETADGLGDTKYVCNYIANKHGIDLEPVEAEVCRSNDSKFQWTRQELEEAAEKGWRIVTLDGGETVVRDQTGKIRKPPSYSPANIAPILEAQKGPQ